MTDCSDCRGDSISLTETMTHVLLEILSFDHESDGACANMAERPWLASVVEFTPWRLKISKITYRRTENSLD